MKIQKLVTISIVATLLLSIAAVFPIYAWSGTSVYIDPEKVEVYTNTANVGDTFTVYLRFGNFSDLAGIEYKLYWNNTVLNFVSVQDTMPWPNYFAATNETTNDATSVGFPGYGRFWFSVVDMGGTPFTGNATLREIVFEIMSEPPEGLGNYLHTLIDIRDTIFGDSTATAIPHAVHDGSFYFHYVMPGKSTITAGSHTATSVTETFYLPVTISNVYEIWQMGSVSFELTYNKTLLEALDVIEGTFFSSKGTTTFSKTIDNINGKVSATITLTAGPPPYPSGGGTLAEIFFNATYGEVGVLFTCPLHLQNVVVKDFSSVDIGYETLEDGLYTMAIPSPALRAIGVEPAATTVTDEAELFTIDIYVYNISSVDKLFGVQFKLGYASSLIELVSIEAGPFLSSFNWSSSPPHVYLFDTCDTDYVSIVTGLLNGGPQPPGYIYPNGNGSIATLTFKSIYGSPGETLCGAFDLYDVIFGDYYAQPIPVGLIHDGMYYITLDKRYIDAYTQYPDPYGGQLRMRDADAYAPQDLVIVCAYVSYNKWPVQNKPVEFEIHGPPNPIYNITLYRTAFTNSDGVACIEFRIDWPCEYAETIAFGTWTVYTAVDLDQVKIVDIIHFEVGWLIQITKITLNTAEYKHGWHMTIELEYESISEQLRPLFLTVTIYDNADYGLGSLTVLLSDVTKGIYTVELTCFSIPKWARAGTAMVYANAYTAQPSQSGVPYCPEVFEDFTILPL